MSLKWYSTSKSGWNKIFRMSWKRDPVWSGQTRIFLTCPLECLGARTPRNASPMNVWNLSVLLGEVADIRVRRWHWKVSALFGQLTAGPAQAPPMILQRKKNLLFYVLCSSIWLCIPTGFPVGSHVAAITHSAGSNNLLFPHANNALKFYLAWNKREK